jgi:outer membrane protein assembly factor BamB
VFNPNFFKGGFELGAYNLNAVQPTTVNWTRQSKFIGPNNPSEKLSILLNTKIVHSSPVIGENGDIYFGSEDGSLYCITTTGRIKWNINLDGCLESAILGSMNTIYIGSRKNKLYAISTDGTYLWEFQTEGKIEFSPSIDKEGNIYFTSHDKTLYSLNSNGKLLWRYENKSIFWSSILIDINGTIYVGSGRNFLALDKQGNLLWSIPIGASYSTTPVINEEGIIFFETNLNGKKGLRAIDVSGNKIWDFYPDKGHISTSATISNENIIYVGSNSFLIHAINNIGKEMWNANVEGFIYYPPILDKRGVIYVVATKEIRNKEKSTLYAFSNDGTLIWEGPKMDGHALMPCIGENGDLIILLRHSNSANSTIQIFNDITN